MQRHRHRKSSAASVTEGFQLAQKQIDGIIRNDMSGQKSLEPTSSLPVRKLRADEVEPKKRSPNVIARLMGLETLPSPRHVQTHQENAIGSHQRMCFSKHLEFKDVYEDLEAASHMANRSFLPKGQAQSIFAEPESARVGDKLKEEAKHLFADENFQYAANEVKVGSNPRDSDEDFFVRYCQPSDNMFVKHIRSPEAQPGSYIAILKPEKYQGIAKPWRLARDTPSVMPHTKRLDGLLLEPDSRQHRACASRKSIRAPLEDTDEGNILSLPTRIVVLKPNVGSHNFPQGGNERMPHGKKEVYRKVGPLRLTSKESREIARKIARKMRMRNSSDATKGGKSTRFIGYAGDESSYDPDETDSDSESEVTTLSSTKSFDDSKSNLSRYSSSPMVGISPNKVANSRLPQKLKSARKYENLKTFTKGTTLGEMLSLTDVDLRPKNLHRSRDGKQNAAPLGISSRDGWSNEDVRLHGNSSSSCSSSISGSPRNFTPRISRSSSDAIFKTLTTADTKEVLEGPHSWENHEKPNHQDSPSSHHLKDEPESSASSKDNADDHRSSISILEAPLGEDPPFSESFERVGAVLHELRKHLHLLKMESGALTDSSNLDETDQTSPNNASERSHTRQESASESWETSYALEDYGTAWDSNGCPMDPKLLFDELRKKYGDEMGSSRSERRLLFDVINLQISEIFRNHIDLYPWVSPGLGLKRPNEALRDAFEKLINEDSSNVEISALDGEMHWPDMKAEINAIGNEIANLLVDEMITDVIMYVN